jgi:hypothetical protein
VIWRRAAFVSTCALAALIVIRPWAERAEAVVISEASPQVGTTNTVCLATFVTATYGATTQTWLTANPPYNGANGWWKFTFPWSYTFNCNIAANPNCSVCRYQEVSYWSTRSNQWIVAWSGTTTTVSDSGNCGTTNTITLTTSYDYPYKAGTSMEITYYFAPFDPSVAATCNGQNYFEQVTQWTIPADGP